jgi:hypothetical protein
MTNVEITVSVPQHVAELVHAQAQAAGESTEDVAALMLGIGLAVIEEGQQAWAHLRHPSHPGNPLRRLYGSDAGTERHLRAVPEGDAP